jgi:hemolysin III
VPSRASQSKTEAFTEVPATDPDARGARPVRSPSPGEEIANCVSHGIALLAAVIALPVLIMSAVERGSPAAVVGAGVFGATVLLLYLTSTLYHAVPRNWTNAKERLRLMDHGAIFLLIAGTYTPFTLGVLRGAWGWTLLGLVWGLALTGMGLKVFGRLRSPMLSACLYVGLGWIVLIAGKAVWSLLPPWGMFWLLAGGIAYTAGVALFAAEKLHYAHLGWHLCVVVGTACHFIAVLWYAG